MHAIKNRRLSRPTALFLSLSRFQWSITSNLVYIRRSNTASGVEENEQKKTTQHGEESEGQRGCCREARGDEGQEEEEEAGDVKLERGACNFPGAWPGEKKVPRANGVALHARRAFVGARS